MKALKNLRMATKILGSFFIIIAGMILIGVLGIQGMRTIDTQLNQIYDRNYMATKHAIELKAALNHLSAYTNQILNERLIGMIDENVVLVDEKEAEAGNYFAGLESTIGNDQVLQAMYDNLMKNVATYQAERTYIINMAIAGDYDTASYENENVLTPMVRDVRGLIDEIVVYTEDGAADMVEESNERFDSTTVMTIAIIAGMVLLAVIIGLVISRLISGGMKSACEVADKIADGDLSVKVPAALTAQKDEIGTLAKNIEVMREGLSETVSGIKASADTLIGAVSNTNTTLDVLNQHITDTSAATEELSAGMEETGASAEEMNATAAEIERAIETVAAKAEDGAVKSGEINHRADSLSKEINESIDKSNEVFAKIKQVLEKALEDSKAVDEINTLADAILGITSQTTLLALNASIEAARAGEAGRGFAVVANEISALANTSKNTVSQIQDVTKVVMTAVNSLAVSANDLLAFVSQDVMNEFKNMRGAAESYGNDAIYISDMTSDLSATAEELLASVQVMMRAITEVSSAAQEGARTTSLVAEQTSDIATNAQAIVDNMHMTGNTASELQGMVDHFKL